MTRRDLLVDTLAADTGEPPDAVAEMIDAALESLPRHRQLRYEVEIDAVMIDFFTGIYRRWAPEIFVRLAAMAHKAALNREMRKAVADEG